MAVPSSPSSGRRSLSLRRISLLALSLLSFAQPGDALPWDPSKISGVPQNIQGGPTPTPKAIPPPLPAVKVFADFPARFRGHGPHWREIEGKGAAWTAPRSDPNTRRPARVIKGATIAERALFGFLKPTSTRKSSTTSSRKTSTTSTKTSTTSTKISSTTSTKTSSRTSTASTSRASSTLSSASSASPASSVVSSSTLMSSSATSSTLTSSSAAPSGPAVPTCVGAWANATYINSVFAYAGPNYVLELCPSTIIILDGPIFLFGSGQVLTTQGRPMDDTRARLVNMAVNETCSIYAALDNTNNIEISSIIVDGSRPIFGPGGSYLATIELGGNNVGQTIKNVWSFEPRGWSSLHIIEGYQNQCDSTNVLNNQLGPSGHAPSGPNQFRKRDSTGQYPPGQWADGISHACKNSLVQGNTITDATDGAIVIFGAPGTLVTGNTIINDDRQGLGGINMVDYNPFSGSFQGVVVSNNQIIAKNSFLKVGIAVGWLSWSTYNETFARTYGGIIQNNVLSSGPTGYFGFGITLAGHINGTILGNVDAGAVYGGVPTQFCFQDQGFPLPPPQFGSMDPWTTPGAVVQPEINNSTQLVWPICRGPNPPAASS